MKQEMSNEEKLQQIEARVKQLEEEKVRKTEQLRIYREQRDAIKVKLAELDLDPLTLPQTINNLKREIADEIRKLEAMIPTDIV